ncbi:MAG: hypothetical protein L0287_08965 [Anaerolineae bacterium]|nr:hypothetical protein [Anaerolineae bacterium]
MAIDPNISKYDQLDLEEVIKHSLYLAKQKAESVKYNAFRSGILKKIASHIAVDNFVDEEKAKLVVLGIDCSWAVSTDQDRKVGTGWRSESSGKYSVTVIENSTKWSRLLQRSVLCEKRRRFPQHKDGSHNYAEIANLVVKYAEQRVACIEADAARKGNAQTAEVLREHLKLHKYDGVMTIDPSSNHTHPFHVVVKVNRAMTAVEVQALHAALLKLGLVTEEKKS